MKITENFLVNSSEVASAEWAGGRFIWKTSQVSFKYPSKSGYIDSQHPHQDLEDALGSDAVATLLKAD